MSFCAVHASLQAPFLCGEGIHSESVKQEFLEHAREEQEHADCLAGRINKLGGAPDFRS
jgi:bacterioferritin